jgi:hypothetical protein
MRWEPVLNALAITSGDRFPAAETLMETAGNTVSEIVPTMPVLLPTTIGAGPS